MQAIDVMLEVRTSSKHNISKQPPIISKVIIVFKNDIKTWQIAITKLQPVNWVIIWLILWEWRFTDGGKDI